MPPRWLHLPLRSGGVPQRRDRLPCRIQVCLAALLLHIAPILLVPRADNPPVTAGARLCEEFQAGLAMSEETLDHASAKYARLVDVVRTFEHLASTYAQAIITEHPLSADDRMIKPSGEFGGVAGGPKYLARGLLFKLASEADARIYGSAESARKTAGHELRASSLLHLMQIDGLSSPLQCIVDFAGCRALVSTLIPIGRNQEPVYGSRDAGAHERARGPAGRPGGLYR